MWLIGSRRTQVGSQRIEMVSPSLLLLVSAAVTGWPVIAGRSPWPQPLVFRTGQSNSGCGDISTPLLSACSGNIGGNIGGSLDVSRCIKQFCSDYNNVGRYGDENSCHRGSDDQGHFLLTR